MSTITPFVSKAATNPALLTAPILILYTAPCSKSKLESMNSCMISPSSSIHSFRFSIKKSIIFLLRYS